MKIILTLFIVLFAFKSYSQTFNGIEVGKSYSTTASLLKQKGFIKTKDLTKSITEFTGQLPSGENVTVVVVQTAKTGIVWKLRVKFGNFSSWSTLKSEYEKYKSILENKYGKAQNDFEIFSKPYYEGDGYEMQGLGKEKVTFAAFFNDDNKNNISVELNGDGSYGYVSISYENTQALETKRTEEQEIEKSVF